MEYKRGKPKHMDCDKVQVCAQSMCLEEMHNIAIPEAEIYYGQIKHREHLALDEDLRKHTGELARKMHAIYDEGTTPKAEYKPCCKSCSLVDLCMPKICGKNAGSYLKREVQCENY